MGSAFKGDMRLVHLFFKIYYNTIAIYLIYIFKRFFYINNIINWGWGGGGGGAIYYNIFLRDTASIFK